MLDGAQLRDWERDGFLVLPEFVPPERCEVLKAHVEALLAGIDPAAPGWPCAASTDGGPLRRSHIGRTGRFGPGVLRRVTTR